MRHIWNCRRTGIAFTAVVLLGVALLTGTDTSSSISMICIGLAGSNAYEKKAK